MLCAGELAHMTFQVVFTGCSSCFQSQQAEDPCGGMSAPWLFRVMQCNRNKSPCQVLPLAAPSIAALCGKYCRSLYQVLPLSAPCVARAHVAFSPFVEDRRPEGLEAGWCGWVVFLPHPANLMPPQVLKRGFSGGVGTKYRKNVQRVCDWRHSLAHSHTHTRVRLV